MLRSDKEYQNLYFIEIVNKNLENTSLNKSWLTYTQTNFFNV